jgi:hypothetical protein
VLGSGAVNVTTAMNKHAAVEELLEAMFSVWFMPRLYSEDPDLKASRAVRQ